MFDQYEAIIFDMDGTLVDSGQLHEVAWTETLNQYGIPIDRPLMRSLAGVPTKKTIEILLDKFSLEAPASLDEMNDYKEAVVAKVAQQYVKPTALLEVAERYAGKKPMSVGTGAYTEEARGIIEHCGIGHLLEHIVGADLVANPKPAPDTFLRCAELMGVAPEKCVVFEDSKLGLEAAERAGMVGIDVLESLGIENDYFL
ncbi:beta-phosphoglucomutase family hydrolase [Gilvimarinus xylanilyticus]|uniref:Beta-phosphoglucomutase family hydrolase n=1 Tax=Gilvimarinus xylanilyticus TaxID=2944139 RepID=A0A9X2I5H3_9GAMM|nr:beta-phosphoglucomutase family hydrolase [Gilvimarinus xylanilyticus]MCP8900983.1 beta-phosphoglucomutase family hydrolase [Gilvimarinus xylanilyticus]